MEIKNRSAYFEYHIEDKYTAGMVLTGTEVKSLRGGRASFNDSYCYFHRGEMWRRRWSTTDCSTDLSEVAARPTVAELASTRCAAVG